MNFFEVVNQERRRLKILTKIRNMIGAGGCIFRQRGDPLYEDRIIEGLNYIKQMRTEKRKGEPFRLIVVSRLDGTARYSGDWERHQQTKHLG